MPKKPGRAEAKLARQKARHEALLLEELPLWAEGLVVAGLDEAGAGPLAGPVTAACVVLDPAQVDALIGVDDSKTLDAATREQHAARIRTHVRAWAVAEATVGEIDRINIREAGLLAMKRALDRVLEQVPELHHLLVDARIVPGTSIPQSDLIKGDARSLSIAAASILAKVERDQVMTAAARHWPAYGFERHKGYGTAEHLEAIRTHGVTPLHRRTFEPVSTLLRQPSLF
ncbi:MAG: ribonuclease HII [Deltaproteobacteria bacterium]|nr:ribonuclease HII [Deltaproteobacteria bacterium]